MEFVVGQWVECVDAGSNTRIMNGGFYRIRKVFTFDGTVDLEDVSGPCFKSRFRPIEWQVGRAYKTTLDGVTATINKMDSLFVYGPRSDTPGDKWMWHVATGLFDGYEDSTSEPHLTPYLANESPAVETTEQIIQSINDELNKPDEPQPAPSRYHRTINGVTLDLYDVAEAYGIDSHRVFHAVKKLVMARRGHKDREQDLREAIVLIESELKKMKGGAA